MMAESGDRILPSSQRQAKKIAQLNRILMKEEQKATLKKVSEILRKPAWDHTENDLQILQKFPEVVRIVQSRMQKTRCLKERNKEAEDPADVLQEKCKQLAEAIQEAKHLVLYTGAGISTAAEIPDYRGPQGIWTLLQKGHHISVKDLSTATPTFTHMAITSLYKAGYVSHVVSQNCDGLHLRSGLPRSVLSEVHGNMFIEVCPKCKPLRQYFRLFDVTERTGFHKHKTGRVCHKCGEELIDTIVHFGERGKLRWPLNWEGAGKAVEKCDMILCLGSSLKVLRKYPCLWAMDRPPDQRPRLYIVNLQWTPKDDQAVLKINGKCDEVMKAIIEHLGVQVPEYARERDPLFRLAMPLKPYELETTSRQQLMPPPKSENCSPKNQRKASLRSSQPVDATFALVDHDYFRSISPSRRPKAEKQDQAVADCDVETDGSKTDVREAQIVLEPLDLSQFNHLNIAAKEEKHETDSQDEDDLQDKLDDNDSKRPKLSGWFGKGYSKWKKRTRRKKT